MGEYVIERFLLKNHLSFAQCELEFSKGLIVFTGPSGAGKSVLMQGVLSLFGYGEAYADVMEMSIDQHLGLEAFGFAEENPNSIKFLKAKSGRYFINTQTISKKGMMELSRTFLNYLSHKDNSEFDNKRLLDLLDAVCEKHYAGHTQAVTSFKRSFEAYQILKDEFTRIEMEEKKIEDLKEFARFEITRIDEVSPKIGEDEELIIFKKTLSKKEKIEQAIQKASEIFNIESSVYEVLNLVEADTAFFDASMNELRLVFEKQQEHLDALEEIDVESLLDRIEKIAQLKKRYGSIEEALEHKKKRQEELAYYENIVFEKKQLEKKLHEATLDIEHQSQQLRAIRVQYLPLLQTCLNDYLEQLYMPHVVLSLEAIELHLQGMDLLHVNLGTVDLKKISSGEYNRLRLAFLATYNTFLLSNGGVLILDEIDSNLSGKEAMSVANVLKLLSDRYQIFAISHQPQLSSRANQHFLVTKDEHNHSFVHALNDVERIHELARMISGEHVTDEAIVFAKTLLESAKL